MDLEENQEFWRNQDNSKAYLGAPMGRTDLLVDLVGHLDLTGKCILEIGCNAGRNLAGLWRAGFRDLMGVEINPKAILAFRETFPECEGVPISTNAVEDIIRSLPSDYYDVVFTMAVLMHVRPESDWIFAEMARISHKYIITIECEISNACNPHGVQRHWARDYGEIFTGLGMQQIHMEQGCSDLVRYVVRVFQH